MRRIITGLDSQGRSAVLSVEDLVESVAEREVGIDHCWLPGQAPPSVTINRPDTAPLIHHEIPLGGTQWLLVRMGGGFESPHLFRTDTLDYDVVLEGEVEFVLDTGTVQLGPNDCVVVPGVAHAWRARAGGCLLSVVMVGLEKIS